MFEASAIEVERALPQRQAASNANAAAGDSKSVDVVTNSTTQMGEADGTLQESVTLVEEATPPAHIHKRMPLRDTQGCGIANEDARIEEPATCDRGGAGDKAAIEGAAAPPPPQPPTTTTTPTPTQPPLFVGPARATARVQQVPDSDDASFVSQVLSRPEV